LCGLPLIYHPNVLAGLERADDAGVYKLTDTLAIIQTLDFFTPIVDDPATFGRIAAANSLSDVYAMGGKPLCAMNIVCFPVKTMGIPVLREILRGGLETMREAGVVLVGGHSIDDKELKYGLSVTGVVHPDRVLRKQGIRAGDHLILTKPIGTGIISTAVKAGLASTAASEAVVQSMTALNARAAGLMEDLPVHGCTDITGFGLLGHACEMVGGTGLGMALTASRVPIFPETARYLEMGLAPGGLRRNLEFREPWVHTSQGFPRELLQILFDPQTSGGLLISLPARDAETLLSRLHEAGISEAADIGVVTTSPREKIVIEA
jgi:selenide,water dikinase